MFRDHGLLPEPRFQAQRLPTVDPIVPEGIEATPGLVTSALGQDVCDLGEHGFRGGELAVAVDDLAFGRRGSRQSGSWMG